MAGHLSGHYEKNYVISCSQSVEISHKMFAERLTVISLCQKYKTGYNKHNSRLLGSSPLNVLHRIPTNIRIHYSIHLLPCLTDE